MTGNVENTRQRLVVSTFPLMFSNVRSVLSQCNTSLRLLYFLYDVDVMWRKTIKHAFFHDLYGLYALIKHGVLTNQSAHRVLFILQVHVYFTSLMFLSWRAKKCKRQVNCSQSLRTLHFDAFWPIVHSKTIENAAENASFRKRFHKWSLLKPHRF